MGRPVVQVRQLSVLRGGRQVLAPVTFDANRGDLVLLRGDSGSGKSTLLHVLAGLIPHHDEGDVFGTAYVAGLALESNDLPAFPQKVALLMQDADDQFCAFDVESEVAFRLETRGVPRGALRRRVDFALARWRLGDMQDRRLDELSGGERRRVLLAALDALEPEVLLLDEPLANLDPRWRREVLRDLARLRRRTTVIVAEHRVDDLLPLATHIVTLRGETRSGRVPRSPTRATAAPPVRVENLAFGVLRGVKFVVAKGLIGVCGPNGAGKTTLARLLTGLERPDAGRILIGRRDAAALEPRQRARLMGYVVQRPGDVLFAPRVRDEVSAGPRAMQPSRAAQLADDGIAFWGLARLSERSPFTLSGGEAQRTALAACLAHDPPIAILDEPTHGLDEDGRRRLTAWLKARRGRGVTFLLTHDEELLGLCPRLLVLEDGRLVDGPKQREVLSATAAPEPDGVEVVA